MHDGSWPIISAEADFVEQPLCAAGRGFAALQPRRRGAAVVGALPGPGPQAARRMGFSIGARRHKTCPKIVETFGSAEMWYLNLSPTFVGTAADADIPLPDNVRRYYIAEHDSWRWRGRIQRYASGDPERLRDELGRVRPARQPDAVHADEQRASVGVPRLGDVRRTNAAEPLPDVGQRDFGCADEGGLGIPDDSGVAANGADRSHQSAFSPTTLVLSSTPTTRPASSRWCRRRSRAS